MSAQSSAATSEVGQIPLPVCLPAYCLWCVSVWLSAFACLQLRRLPQAGKCKQETRNNRNKQSTLSEILNRFVKVQSDNLRVRASTSRGLPQPPPSQGSTWKSPWRKMGAASGRAPTGWTWAASPPSSASSRLLSPWRSSGSSSSTPGS